MCNNAPVVRDILKHWRRKPNSTAADSRPRWTRLPWTAPVKWNLLLLGKCLLLDAQHRGHAVFYRRFVSPVRRSAPAASGALVTEDGASAAGTISLLCLLSIARLSGGRSLFCKCSMTCRWGVCKGFSRPCIPHRPPTPPQSAGFPQLRPCTWQLIHNKQQQRDVRIHIFREVEERHHGINI